MEYIVILLLIVGFCLSVVNKQSKKKQTLQKMKERNASVVFDFKHTTGLPLAQDTLVSVYGCDTHLLIESPATKVRLDYFKIRDLAVVTSTEILNQKVSSIGGAVAGAVLLGPLGAIVGGRAKNHKTKKIDKYLVAIYDKGDNLEQLSFHLPEMVDESNADKLIKVIKPKIQQSAKEIVL